MRRRSERGKTKPAAKEEESPEKVVRKSHRHTRRRKKSSSSSDEDSKNSKKEVEKLAQPLEIQVQDIELPQGQGPNSASGTANADAEPPAISEEPNKEWKEDSTFWDSEAPKPTQEEKPGEEKEGGSMWKVQSANGASGGEIQKLKICRQKPTESPEIGETSLRKRLSRGPRDSRSTDESTQEESEKETKKLKHRTRTSSRNSPLVSPSVVCDMSEGSPTKIKIINVSHLNTDNKGAKPTSDETVDGENSESKTDLILEISTASDTLDIALPKEESIKIIEADDSKVVIEDKNEISISDVSLVTTEEIVKEKTEELAQTELSKEDTSTKTTPRKSTSPSPSPVKDLSKTPPSGSSGDSDSSRDESQPRKVKKKRHRGLQSAIQRKLSTSASPKHESSDSEDDVAKKKEDRRESTDTNDTKDNVNDKENGAENIASKDITVEDSNDKPERTLMPRKRRWGSSKTNRSNKKPDLNINTDCLKSLIPDAKPVPADELQLSVEEEEGQLDDDDDDDEVVAIVASEEEKQLERDRLREERQKEREKELAKQEEDKRKRHERFSKTESKSEQPPPTETLDKGASSRKILLLTEDAKKLAKSPSPSRHKPTSVLYITHLVRPFTVQQLKNLLLRTGAIAENGFWIDKIKSKCYVEYMTEDQAVETRHALHGVRWPTSNPKTLVVEFASKDDLVMAQALTEEPDVPRKSEPLNMVEGWVADQARIKERTKRAVVREWDVGKPEHPDEALDYEMKIKEKREQERKARKEKHHRSATPENEPPARKSRRKEEDAPAKLLDDLFRKTKTSPCIYWLPLTQEQIAVKEEIRRQHMAEHERRMAELKKADVARREREKRNRK